MEDCNEKLVSVILVLMVFGMTYAFAYDEDLNQSQNNEGYNSGQTTDKDWTFFQIGIAPYCPAINVITDGWLPFCPIFNVYFRFGHMSYNRKLRE